MLDRSCWVLELTAKSGTDPAYHSRKLWVDKERYLVLKEERFATSGKLLKTSEVTKVAMMRGSPPLVPTIIIRRRQP